MKGKKHREYVIEIAKKLLLFGLLLVITLVLLEIPLKLFRNSDARLLEEKGESVYELKAVEKDMLLFSEKLKMFVNSEPIREFSEFEPFSKDELILEEVALADEIDLLLDSMYKFVTDELRQGKMISNGFVAEVCCDIEKTEYTWNVGLLTFEGKDFAYEGIVIYDFDSKKIFYLEMHDRNMTKYDIHMEVENLWLESVMEYYEGLDVQWLEATVQRDPAVVIFPAYLEAFKSDVLYWTLRDTYYKLIEEEGAQEIPFSEYQFFYN